VARDPAKALEVLGQPRGSPGGLLKKLPLNQVATAGSDRRILPDCQVTIVSLNRLKEAAVGIYDSARTRIAPVFGRLQCLDPSGRLWLQGLLELGNSRKLATPRGGTAALRVAKWWPRQARLAAPPGLLRWLLENAEKPRTAAAWGRHPEVKENRRRVVDRDAATVTEALKRLDERRGSGRAWYVLEGPTQPDVYLDTEEAVIVIEGKRSEPGPTTSTAWMPVRHQMLRQLDAAWEVRQGRRIYGLFIVEADERTGSLVPPVWREVADMTISEEVLRGSLPHRTPEERSEIASALLGVTTWQAVCEEFQIPLQVLIEEVFDDRPEPRATRRRSGGTQQPSLPDELESAGVSRTTGE
jgi:hypothetical protein